MSRTDKDMPDWVQATWWEPRHHWRCQFVMGITKCTLPEDIPLDSFSWLNRKTECSWIPDTSYRQGWQRWDHPRYIWRHLNWYGPERRHVRDWCMGQVKRTRTGDEVDPLQPERQHRHGAWKGWW